jgi:hypothetical protein
VVSQYNHTLEVPVLISGCLFGQLSSHEEGQVSLGEMGPWGPTHIVQYRRTADSVSIASTSKSKS